MVRGIISQSAAKRIEVLAQADRIHDPIHLGDGQRTKQQRIDCAENRCGGANPESERSNSGRGEGHVAAQNAKAEHQITPGIFDPTHSARLPALLLQLVESAKFKSRRSYCFIAAHPLSKMSLNEVIEMVSQLTIHLGFDSTSPQKCTNTKNDIAPHKTLSRLRESR